jgi:t-SNARE complex subunit (syntaxin)
MSIWSRGNYKTFTRSKERQALDKAQKKAKSEEKQKKLLEEVAKLAPLQVREAAQWQLPRQVKVRNGMHKLMMWLWQTANPQPS